MYMCVCRILNVHSDIEGIAIGTQFSCSSDDRRSLNVSERSSVASAGSVAFLEVLQSPSPTCTSLSYRFYDAIVGARHVQALKYFFVGCHRFM